MKQLTLLMFCISTSIFFLACNEDQAILSTPEAQVRGIENSINYDSEFEVGRRRRVRVKLRHSGVYKPGKPDHCGNQGGCVCPLGFCVILGAQSVPSDYFPNTEEIEEDWGVADVDFSVDLTLARLHFLQNTAVEDGTIPLDEPMAIYFENDPDFGNATLYIQPNVYPVDFSDSEYGNIVVPLEQ